MIKLCFERGYNRIAFGHHFDDIIETLLMNMVHHGNISTMPPRVDLFDGRIAIIRPLSFVFEEQCRDYAHSQIFVPPKCRCTGLDESVRRDTKEFIASLQQQVPAVKENLMRFLRTARTAAL
jgi:tRNA 2-thiocytidine biosynthesis protein TtcA